MNRHSTTRRRLSDILAGDDTIRRDWDKTEAADDFAPLPSGTYVARIIGGELSTATTTGTPGFKLTFRVLEGGHTGRQFWHDVWLTPAALPMAKRDLAKLGVTSLDQLARPLPPGIRCKVRLVLRSDDNGEQVNRVRSFEVVGIDEPERDAFAPDDDTGDAAGCETTEVSADRDTDTEACGDGDGHHNADNEAGADAGGNERGGDGSFDFGKNSKPRPSGTAWAGR